MGTTLIVSLGYSNLHCSYFQSDVLNGLTLNIMTLGEDWRSGRVCWWDNAIVVIESIFRKSGKYGSSIKEAAINGTAEAANAVIVYSDYYCRLPCRLFIFTELRANCLKIRHGR